MTSIIFLLPVWNIAPCLALLVWCSTLRNPLGAFWAALKVLILFRNLNTRHRPTFTSTLDLLSYRNFSHCFSLLKKNSKCFSPTKQSERRSSPFLQLNLAKSLCHYMQATSRLGRRTVSLSVQGFQAQFTVAMDDVYDCKSVKGFQP